jgi:hypothetical protein
MFSYSPQVADRSGEITAAGQIASANTQANMYNQLGNNIGGALASLGGMYGQYKDKKDMLAGMDSAVGAMSDAGALPEGFLKNYIQLDDNVRPFIFQAIASPMFQSYNAGQSAAAQAQAWDKYKKTWGGAAGGQPDGFTY